MLCEIVADARNDLQMSKRTLQWLNLNNNKTKLQTFDVKSQWGGGPKNQKWQKRGRQLSGPLSLSWRLRGFDETVEWYKFQDYILIKRTNFAVGILIIKNPKGDGWKETSKVKKEGRWQNFLWRLSSDDAIDVVGNVMRETSAKIFANALPKLAEFPNILSKNKTLTD